MKKRGMFAEILLVLCLVLTGAVGFFVVGTVSAKEITSAGQAKKLAKKEVKGARVVEVERDHDDGILEYEVKLIKGKKEYDLKYRAADAKLISYTWEIESVYVAKGSGHMISKKKCKKIARKKVPGGTILSVVKKRSDGIDIYKVKMRAHGKRYEMEIHARSGKVLEYDWELISKQYARNTKTASAASKKPQSQVSTQPQRPVKPQVSAQPQVSTQPVQPQVTTQPQQPAAPIVPTVKPGVSGDIISAEQANQIALTQVPGASLIKSEFDIDDGISVYEVELLLDDFEYDVKIDAVTGAVIEVEKESIYD